jgi:methylaspartate mutase epsilon subunit
MTQVRDEQWPLERLFEARDREVRSQWQTDLGGLDETVERQRSLRDVSRADIVLRKAREVGRTVVQPRHGETLVEGQIAAMQALVEAGADIVSVLTDPYTRQLQFANAESALRESEAEQRSLISGYPIASAPVEMTRRIVDSVDRPCSVRMASSDSRLAKELYLAAGFTYMFMGPVQNLAYEKLATPELLIENYQYEDRLIGYLEEQGCPVVKELPATLTGTLVPPCIALTSTLIDAMLAVRQGVRRVVCSYGLLGNLIQDVAAIRVLRELTESLVPKAAPQEIETYVVTPQWMGDFPLDTSEAYAVVLTGTIAAGLGGSDVVVSKSLDEAFGVPTTEANVAGVRTTRQTLDLLRGQRLEDSEQLLGEMDVIRRSVVAILDRVYDLGDGDLAVGAAAAIRAGVVDVPFSPNVHNRGDALPARDGTGAVRWLTSGSIPLPDDVLSFHADAMAGRRASRPETPDYQLMVDDVVGYSRGLSNFERPALPTA